MVRHLFLSVVFGWAGISMMFPDPPAPLTRHQKMVERQHAKVCAKKKLKAKTKQLCREWGYESS
jgi:hypothetical protein